MKKILLQVVLIAVIIVLIYWFYTLINNPLEFEKERTRREAAVIERLKDIRTVQRAYRAKYFRFTPNFDTLTYFVQHDSIVLEKAIGSEDDSLAVAQGRVTRIQYKMAVKDTIVPAGFDPTVLKYIPYSDVVNESLGRGAKFEEFYMDTASIETESKVVVPVFEASAPYITFLGDLNEQELINFRDIRINTLGRDDGLKVGSLQSTTNESGNWE